MPQRNRSPAFYPFDSGADGVDDFAVSLFFTFVSPFRIIVGSSDHDINRAMVASEASNRSRDKGVFYASQSSRLPTPVGLKVTDRRVVICILDDARARASIDRYDGVYRAIIARSGCLPVSSYPFVVPVDISSLPFHRCDINTRRVRRSSPTRVTSSSDS